MNDAIHIPIKIRKDVPSPWKVRVPSRLEGQTQTTSLYSKPTMLPLWMMMFRSRSSALRVVALFLIVALNATGLSQTGMTAAYFFDEEVSTGNTFTAGLVDFTLTNSSFAPTSTALNLAPGTSTGKIILVTMNDAANPTQYYASSTNFSGDQAFCVDLQANIGTSSYLYNGALKSLVSSTSTASLSMVESWTLNLSLPATSTQVNSYCAFDTDFNGWQTRHNYPAYQDAFHDTETVSHQVTSWGLRINKVYYDVDESENVTPAICDGLSPGYWATHDGCHNGSGNSAWKSIVSAVSSGFSGVFVNTSASQMCKALVTSLCPAANTIAGKKCRAKRQLLTNEINVSAWNLSLDAIIAGGDNGDPAFDALGLTSTSTIRQAIIIAESIVANPASTAADFTNVTIVMERIHTFYEFENTDAPYCQYNPGHHSARGTEPENEWVELYNQTNQPIDVNGWSLCDDAACESLFTSSTSTIPPNGFAVVTGSSSTWDFWNVPNNIVRVVVPDGSIGNGLGNDGDMLLLKRPSDQYPIDQMNYGTVDFGWANANASLWVPGVATATEGHMLSRKPTGYDTDQVSDWGVYAPPHAQLIYPTSTEDGAVWLDWGQNIDITWTATNPNGPNSDLLIDLFYIEDIDFTTSITTSDRVTPIATSTANDGLFNWTVPSGFTGWVWVKLLARGPENPMVNTLVTSGRIWDPPAPINELWGVEQETQPIDDEEYYTPEELEEIVSETDMASSTATSTEETATTTPPTGGSTEGGSVASDTEDHPGEETATTTATSTETTTEEETSTSTDATASSTEEVMSTSTEETIPPIETQDEEVPPPVNTDAREEDVEGQVTTHEIPEETETPPPVDTEAREEDVSGGVTTPEVPAAPDPVPPALEPTPEPAPAPVTPAE